MRLFCQDGKASAAASLWYKTPEQTVRSLFHDPHGGHSFSTLLVFTIIYFFLACWTYGMYISSGLFVPVLLIGASWGRLIGMCLNRYAFPTMDWGDPGKYALIGASAQLAGSWHHQVYLFLDSHHFRSHGKSHLYLPGFRHRLWGQDHWGLYQRRPL